MRSRVQHGTTTTGTTGWTSYNQPSSLTGFGGTVSFLSYNQDHQRWKQEANYTTGTVISIYVGGLMEKVSDSSGTTYRHYIQAGSNQVLYSRSGTGTVSTYYITTDHQGSTNLITDSAGTVAINESFVAWGTRRGASWTGVALTPQEQASIAATTRMGFTGQEMMDYAALINYNGRVYHSSLQRFFSPDPYISDPTNTQNFNRYAYVENNPLSYTDPSGFDANQPTKPWHPLGDWRIVYQSGSVTSSTTDWRVDSYWTDNEGVRHYNPPSFDRTRTFSIGSYDRVVRELALRFGQLPGAADGRDYRDTVGEVVVTASGPQTQPTNCPAVPAAPPGVNINDNIDIAKDYSWLNPGADVALYVNVGNYGPWDYKRQGRQYENFGNFNFGAVTAAMGMPYYVAQNGAGIYQQWKGAAAAGSGTPIIKWPYGDANSDAKQIQLGRLYVQQGCSGGTK